MKIKELRQLLEEARSDAYVYFDFCGCFPTKIISWRGLYSEPAIGWCSSDVNPQKHKIKNVAELLDELNAATSGQLYSGYKSRDFYFTEEHTLHVDNYGKCTGTEIIGVEIHDYMVVIKTEYDHRNRV